MKSLIEKIKAIRTKKGYSHEYMGHMLNISQVAYTKIEKGETKLSVERLYKIAEILGLQVEIQFDEKATIALENKDSRGKKIELFRRSNRG